jgi:putative transposase
VLKAHDLITSPAFVVVKAADVFAEQTTGPNQLWQPDFTYLKVIGWGWFYLSTILDDYCRFIVARKLGTTMRPGDVTDTLDLAFAASRCNTARVVHRPRLLSDNGSSYVAADLARWLEGSSSDAGLNESLIDRPHVCSERRSRAPQSAPTEPRSPDQACRGSRRE